ncbi:autotransporter domain-containing protein [Mesorhizobium sp. NPDC059025]|uniref:autotransporter domain-containing protein n=1 Tax=unclassified Mesorhizobium TaxID=325217 RepID=UPI0036B0C086
MTTYSIKLPFRAVSCAALIVAATASAVWGQSATNIGAAKLLSPITTLNSTPAGREVLAKNLAGAIEINNKASETQKAQAFKDDLKTKESGIGLADGFGTKLYQIYQQASPILPNADDPTHPLETAISGSFYDLFKYAKKTLKSDKDFVKSFFANGETDEGSEPDGIALPEGGIINIYDTVYQPPADTKGANGNSRPFQSRPNLIKKFSGLDFFGKPTSSAALFAEDKSPSFPSGHSTYGYYQAMLLAIMVPERFQEMMTRGSEYANSRIVLGFHHPLDAIASRILVTYDLVQLLNGNPDFANSKFGDFPVLLSRSTADLRRLFEEKCGTSIASCILSGATDRFSNYQQNRADYTHQLTYGLPSVGPTDLPMIVPQGAEVLLASRFPYLDADQRREVLATTGLPSGSPLDNSAPQFRGYARLNLFAAADGYGAFRSNVPVTMDAGQGGFNALDVWRNDIGGSGGLTKAGSGTLVLQGSNTYSGGTIVKGGTLRSGAANALVSNTAYTIDGGILDLNGYRLTASSLSGAGGEVALGGGTLTVGQTANTATAYAGTITGSGSLIKDGGGTLILQGPNTYSGGTVVKGGILRSGAANAFAGNRAYTIDGGALDLNGYRLTASSLSGDGGRVMLGGAGLTVDQAANLITTYAGAITGSGGLIKAGGGTLVLTGTSSYSGDTTVSGGKLQFGNGSLGGGNDLAGSIDVTAGELSIQTPATMKVGKSATFAANTTLSIVAKSSGPSLRAEQVKLGDRVAFNLGGVDATSGAAKVLIDTASGISGDVNTVTVGGFNGAVDYLTFSTGKSANNKQYLSTYELTWIAGGRQSSKGTFTLSNVGDNFNVGAALADQAANLATGWNGTSLTKQGPGTLILSGANTYSGGTTIAAGTLQLGDGGTSGSIAGNVVNNATLAFNRSDNATFGGGISGSGRVNQIGSGTLILSGANSYTGGTTISGGTLSISTDASLGAVSGGVTFAGGMLTTTGTFDTRRNIELQQAGQFDVAAGTQLGLNGGVSGAGDLTKRGMGTLVLTGTNAYANTLVQAGRLVGNARSISGNIGNAGTVVFDQAGVATYAGNISALGGLQNGAMIKRGTGSLTLTGTSSLDWAVEAGTLIASAERFNGNLAIKPDGALRFDQASNATYAGLISGAGSLTKQGAGTLKLTGYSADFAGKTTVASGTLSLDGSLGGTVDVLSGARLQGNGKLGSLVVANGGRIAPGNSIGTLNVAGDMVLAAGSIYEVEIAANGTSDRIMAGGKAMLGAAKVEVIALDPKTSYRDGQTYTILNAAGGITGSFDPVVLSRSTFLDTSLAQGTTAVNMTIATKRQDGEPLFATVADTFNRKQAAGALDTLRQSGQSLVLYNKLLPLSADEARSAIDQLSGEVHGSTVAGLIEGSQLLQNTINDRLRAAFETPGTATLPAAAYSLEARAVSGLTAAPVGRTGPGSGEHNGVWGSAFGSWGSIGSDGNAARLSRSNSGFLAGIDGFVTNDWQLGLLAGYSHSAFKLDGHAASASSDNYHFGVYGGTQWGAMSLRSGLAYTWSDIDTSRQVSFPGFVDAPSANYRAGTTRLFGELGYGIKAGSVAFEPFAGLAYVDVRSNGFVEKGGAAALTGHSGSNDVAFTTLGLRGSVDFELGMTNAIARGMIGWRHGFGDVTPLVTQDFIGGSAFTVAGAPLAKNSAVVEAGLDVAIMPSATVGISYQGQIGSNASNHGVRADLNIKF